MYGQYIHSFPSKFVPGCHWHCKKLIQDKKRKSSVSISVFKRYKKTSTMSGDYVNSSNNHVSELIKLEEKEEPWLLFNTWYVLLSTLKKKIPVGVVVEKNIWKLIYPGVNVNCILHACKMFLSCPAKLLSYYIQVQYIIYNTIISNAVSLII